MGKARTRFVATNNYIRTTRDEAHVVASKYGRECIYCREYFPNAIKDKVHVCKSCYSKSRY